MPFISSLCTAFPMVSSSIFSFTSTWNNTSGLITYVLLGLALMWIGEQCGAQRPWLSWIPFARIWHLGWIAEACADINGAKKRKYSKALLGLSIAIAAIAIVFFILSIIIVTAVIIALYGQAGDALAYINTGNWDELVTEETIGLLVGSLLPTVLLLAVVSLAISVVAIIFAVYYYQALWQIFKLYAPQYVFFIYLKKRNRSRGSDCAGPEKR